MFEYYSHIHVYSPGAGTDNSMWLNLFDKYQSSVHLPIPKLAHSADEYNFHGAKRLFTIPNVLSASRPSVNQDDENKPFFTQRLFHIEFHR